MSWSRSLLRLAFGRRLPVTTGTLRVPGTSGRVTVDRVSDAGSQPVEVDAAAEARAVGELQTWLRGKAAGGGPAEKGGR